MSGPDAPARFIRELDAEWLRQELSASLPASDVDEQELLRALIAADPLAPRRRWLDALGEVVAAWPGRLVVAGATCALVVAGFFGGQALQRPVTGVPPTPVITPERSIRIADGPTGVPPAPTYTPERSRRLGATGAGRESDETVTRAMTFYGQPDFATRAVPLLREAIALDPQNDRAHFWLGIAMLLDRRAAQAIPSLEEASRLAAQSLVYKRYLLFAYLATGTTDKALALQAELLKTP